MIRTLNLCRSELHGGLSIRARFQGDSVAEWGTLHGAIDLAECEFFTGLSFVKSRFDEASILNLSGTRIRGDLVLAGLPSLPQEIHLDGATITGSTRIEAELGTLKPRIIASEKVPNFGGNVVFMNVDLRGCLLVGNVIERMEFATIDWSRRWRRCVLYDEITLRNGRNLPVANLRETYQILKQKYQQKGDHVRAGDFHYGEMEMKRREYGWLGRGLSWEALYWALSGYGSGHLRVFIWLAFLVLGFAFIYFYTSPGTFGGLGDALHFSLSVTALQRPEVPAGLGTLGRWLHLVQAILGPVLIALFVLALRMRLKR